MTVISPYRLGSKVLTTLKPKEECLEGYRFLGLGFPQTRLMTPVGNGWHKEGAAVPESSVSINWHPAKGFSVFLGAFVVPAVGMDFLHAPANVFRTSEETAIFIAANVGAPAQRQDS